MVLCRLLCSMCPQRFVHTALSEEAAAHERLRCLFHTCLGSLDSNMVCLPWQESDFKARSAQVISTDMMEEPSLEDFL